MACLDALGKGGQIHRLRVGAGGGAAAVRLGGAGGQQGQAQHGGSAQGNELFHNGILLKIIKFLRCGNQNAGPHGPGQAGGRAMRPIVCPVWRISLRLGLV